MHFQHLNEYVFICVCILALAMDVKQINFNFVLKWLCEIVMRCKQCLVMNGSKLSFIVRIGGCLTNLSINIPFHSNRLTCHEACWLISFYLNTLSGHNVLVFDNEILVLVHYVSLNSLTKIAHLFTTDQPNKPL